jgi:hypothetical protein
MLIEGICAVALMCMLASCAVPLGSHFAPGKVQAVRYSDAGATNEAVVTRTKVSEYYALLTLDNFGRQSTSRELYYLKKGQKYIALPFLNPREPLFDGGDYKTVVQVVPVSGTRLWLALRQEHLERDFADYTIISFKEGSVVNRRHIKNVERGGSGFVFGKGNRSVEVRTASGPILIDLVNDNATPK